MKIIDKNRIHEKDEQPKVEMDECVSCGKETIYPKNMHIDYRYNYVEGSGQLCQECADRIYKIKNV